MLCVAAEEVYIWPLWYSYSPFCSNVFLYLKIGKLSGHTGVTCAHMARGPHWVSPRVASPHLLRQGLSLNLELTDWLDWLASKSYESSCTRITGLECRTFYISAGESQFESHACLASILPVEPCPQTQEVIFDYYSLCGLKTIKLLRPCYRNADRKSTCCNSNALCSHHTCT